ncbi:hypothetical protein IQ246_06495, partial [aff. Roholtiella sp. LEGE 12411]|nr:hypothetical protein [aff. Roholtiella sp. LEGE 12411]
PFPIPHSPCPILHAPFSMPHSPCPIPCLYESVHESNRITIVDAYLFDYLA